MSEQNNKDRKPEAERTEEEKLDEGKLEDEIRIMAEDVQVPPSLEPEAVEDLLRDKAKKRRRKYLLRYVGAAAACLCIAVGAAQIYRNDNRTGDDAAENRTAAESGGITDITDEAMMEMSGAPGLTAAADYDEIYDSIQVQKEEWESSAGSYDTGSVAESAADSSAAASGAESGSASSYAGGASEGSRSYSDTNVREEGVAEGDIVKTDGENLYIVNGKAVEIVGINAEEMEELSQIRIESLDDVYITELYAEAGRLAVFYQRTEYDDGEDGYGYYRDFACVDVYDVSDPAKPEKLDTISQSGNYSTMRAKDGYIYMLSNFYADTAAPRTNMEGYVPAVQGKILEASAIYMPGRMAGSQYTVVSSFALEDPSEKVDSKAVFGTGGICYVSADNIYVAESYYGEDNADVTQTCIRKVSYKDGALEGVAQTTIDGTLNDSFSIDEYEGYLRLVTTVTPIQSGGGNGWFDDSALTGGVEDVETNSLYILDGKLETVGELHDIAPDESVYSARFMGDTGYFVTFKQVDPLFSVDLSDPANPQIIGELKIPGFSEYLHPYGDGKLLGIGMDVDDESVTTDGVKVSMFDISDPSDVKETDVHVLEDMYGTDVAYDYKAVFVDVEKNLFGFLAYGSSNQYTVLTYDDENGFSEVFSREMPGYGSVRGMYVDDTFYLVSGNTVESYSLSGFVKLDDIVL